MHACFLYSKSKRIYGLFGLINKKMIKLKTPFAVLFGLRTESLCRSVAVYKFPQTGNRVQYTLRAYKCPNRTNWKRWNCILEHVYSTRELFNWKKAQTKTERSAFHNDRFSADCAAMRSKYA